MRLAFCFISNNVNRFHKFSENFNYNIVDPSNTCIDSYSKYVLFNPPMPFCNRWDDWNVGWLNYTPRGAIDYFSLRQASLDMAKNSEIIYIGDDDFIFQEGSTKVINQCIAYMQEYRDCGAIYLGKNFGKAGKNHGEGIYISNSGHLGTNRGILLRNRSEDLLDNRLHALGANEDFVIGFTCLLQGYYIARRLHVPIDHSRERNNLEEDNPNINYNLQYLRSKGIMSKINEHIGEWHDHNFWPKNIFKIYNHSARDKGWQPKYSTHGEIACWLL